MIQLVVNVNLLREIDERKLINAYARHMYNDESDTNDDDKIKENLIQLLDWDINGDNGLGIYCGKFESIKRRDWPVLIQFIKDNRKEILNLSYIPKKKRKLESIKLVLSEIERKKKKTTEHYLDENYKLGNRGVPNKPCNYKGKTYQSRRECWEKEGITQAELYKYLALTGQLGDTPLARKYVKNDKENKIK